MTAGSTVGAAFIQLLVSTTCFSYYSSRTVFGKCVSSMGMRNLMGLISVFISSAYFSLSPIVLTKELFSFRPGETISKWDVVTLE